MIHSFEKSDALLGCGVGAGLGLGAWEMLGAWEGADDGFREGSDDNEGFWESLGSKLGCELSEGAEDIDGFLDGFWETLGSKLGFEEGTDDWETLGAKLCCAVDSSVFGAVTMEGTPEGACDCELTTTIIGCITSAIR